MQDGCAFGDRCGETRVGLTVAGIAVHAWKLASRFGCGVGPCIISCTLSKGSRLSRFTFKLFVPLSSADDETTTSDLL